MPTVLTRHLVVKAFLIVTAIVSQQGCDGSSEVDAPRGLATPLLTEASDAELVVEPMTPVIGGRVKLTGSGWPAHGEVGLWIYPSELELREAFDAGAIHEIAEVTTGDGTFEKGFVVPEALCLRDERCLTVEPGDEFQVAATARVEGGSFWKTRNIVIKEGES